MYINGDLLEMIIQEIHCTINTVTEYERRRKYEHEYLRSSLLLGSG